MEQFNIGDKVELIENYMDWSAGSRGTVTSVANVVHDENEGPLLDVKADRALDGDTNMSAFAFRFNKVTKPEIKAGDTVTVERADWTAFGNERKGYTLMGEVYELDGALWVGPISLGMHDVKVIAHAPAPKPALPTRVLTIVAPGNESDRSRAVLLSDGKWYFGGHVSVYSETDPNEWFGGWRIIHDSAEADA